jgi:NitT/TauT family transport system substrate-binding protein
MANIATDALLQRIAGGADDLRAVASPNKSLPFLIAARAGLDSPADLAGKTFGVGRIGSLDHSLSSKVLEAAGASMDAMQIVTLGQPAVRAQALMAGQIDATTMSIGTYTSLPDRSGIHVLIDADAYYAAAPVVTKVNVVTAEVLRDRGAEVEAVLAALTRASRDFASDPTLWVEAMAAARPDIARATLQDLAQSYAKSWNVNGGLQKDELAYTAEWLYQGSDFKDLARIPLDGWVEFAPMDAVLARLGPAAGMDPVSR